MVVVKATLFLVVLLLFVLIDHALKLFLSILSHFVVFFICFIFTELCVSRDQNCHFANRFLSHLRGRLLDFLLLLGLFFVFRRTFDIEFFENPIKLAGQPHLFVAYGSFTLGWHSAKCDGSALALRTITANIVIEVDVRAICLVCGHVLEHFLPEGLWRLQIPSRAELSFEDGRAWITFHCSGIGPVGRVCFFDLRCSLVVHQVWYIFPWQLPPGRLDIDYGFW